MDYTDYKDWKNSPDFVIKLSIDGIGISSKDLYEIKHNEENFLEKNKKITQNLFFG